MAINISDNIRVNAGKPVDAKYLSSTNTPYASVAAVNAAISIPERHVGLTVNVLGLEYWYSGGVTDINLIEKKYDSVIPSGDFVTGATNIGFFSGKTGVQVLPINYAIGTAYDDDYLSLYGYYYRGTDGKIHVGAPSDGILRRGYYAPIKNKSWIWNKDTGGSYLMAGWIFIDGNISNLIGTSQVGQLYYPPSSPYTYSTWTTGTNPNNLSNVVFDVIRGSLNTGNTITVGGAVYSNKTGKLLNFRTIQTKTPSILTVTQDDANIYLSGKTQITQGANLGAGSQVFKTLTGNELQFRTIVGSGDTVVSQVGNEVVIYSSGGTGTGGGGTYDRSTPAAITLGGINAGTQLTGKTSFQLFEELLVPALNPALVAPDNTFGISSPSGSQFEMGQILSPINFSVSFSRGSITPPYGTSGFRSGAFVRYNFTGTGLPATGTTAPSISSYGVLASQNWTASATYLIGEQPKNSKGGNYSTALPAGTTTPKVVGISGIYPYFWGVSMGLPVAGQLLIDGTYGTSNKVVIPSAGNVTVDFHVQSPTQFFWLAIPVGATKHKWEGSNAPSTNTEPIPGGLFSAPTTMSVNSPTSLWSGVSYEFYISNYATNTYAGGNYYTITFKNS